MSEIAPMALIERGSHEDHEVPGSRRGRTRLLVAIAAAGSLAACAVNPVSGRREVTLISASTERELGAEEAKKVATAMGLVEDGRLVAYVREVGARVAAHSPLTSVTYSFAIVDMPEPNAFSLPGGYVYVSRGLLAVTNSEDELAGVLGHEIGHIAARHAVQRISRAAPIGILAGIGAMTTGMVSPMLGDIVGGVGSAVNTAVLAPYGRDQEHEADRVGAELSAKAGWDPGALAASLHTLEREDALSHKNAASRSSFFATHPPLPERVADLRRHASELTRSSASPIAASHEAFLQKLDGLVIGQSAADGVFQEQTFVHPELGFALTFPKDWKTRNERDAVGAVTSDGRAAIVLEVVGDGDDPAAAVAAIDKAAGSNLSSRLDRLTIGGCPAVHLTGQAMSSEGPLAVDVTWVALGGKIYRVLGATAPASFEQHASTFRATAATFHAPTAAELGRVRETRLRIVRARDGESIANLVVRAHGAWKPDMAAVANGLEIDARLRGEQPVKMAVSEPYKSTR
jgi:predicted Zn-dependent protease